jgi:hypothetical protein
MQNFTIKKIWSCEKHECHVMIAMLYCGQHSVRRIHQIYCKSLHHWITVYRTRVHTVIAFISEYSSNFFPLAIQPNSCLDHLHETFRFTSVTRARTVGRTSWNGDQLVAKPLPLHKHRKTHTQHKY